MQARSYVGVASVRQLAGLVVFGGLILFASGCAGTGNLEATRRLSPGSYETLYPREAVEGLPSWQRDDVVRGDGGN